MLDSIRASVLGRANYPHQHFMATGAHAITFVGHGTGAKKSKAQEQYTRDFLWIMEKLTRIHD